MPSKVGLCGQPVCQHICSRVCYCPVGLELSYRRLRAQRAQRERRQEWHDEKQFNDQCEKWWSGGLLPSLIDLLRRR